MSKKVRFGVLVPTHYVGRMPEAGDFARWFKGIEELGFSEIWILDRIFTDSHVADAMPMLAWAAALTSKIRLGTAVMLLPHRDPILFAKEVATIDYISGGRLDFGVGLGGRDVEFSALGMSIKERVGRFRENLEIMRKLWTQKNVSHQGKYHDFEGVTVAPYPVQDPIPVFIGGEADGVLKRTVELADGWIGGSRNNPQVFAEKYKKIRVFAEAVGRDPDTIDCGTLVFMAAGKNRDSLREQLRSCTSAIYGPQYDVDQYTTFGPPGLCAERLSALIRAGATNLVIGVPALDLEHLQALAEDVLPLVNGK